MEQHDVERIARAALKEFGVAVADVSIESDGRPGHWRIEIRGGSRGPGTLKVKCGQGTTPQWVREQIVDQYTQ